MLEEGCRGGSTYAGRAVGGFTMCLVGGMFPCVGCVMYIHSIHVDYVVCGYLCICCVRVYMCVCLCLC